MAGMQDISRMIVDPLLALFDSFIFIKIYDSIGRIKREIEEKMRRDGFLTMKELIGCESEENLSS